MTVIEFPRKSEIPVAEEAESQLGDTLETAFEVHRMIFNAVSMEPLRENPGALSSVLLFAMSKHFGPDLVRWAEMQFETVYGIDPGGFIHHVTADCD